MKASFLWFFCIIFIATISFAADNTLTNDSPAAQKERLFQRFLKEMQQSMQEMGQTNDPDLSSTNAEAQAALRRVFDSMIVDPSFGLKWDEVPTPTLTGSNALAGVDAFIAANGWNMQTNEYIFDRLPYDGNPIQSAPIRGLPWAAIHEKEFHAVTHDHILYVSFGGFHHDGHGVVYDPQTNHFSSTINAFKPIGQHWYAWAFDHEFPSSVPPPQIYEGAKPSIILTPPK